MTTSITATHLFQGTRPVENQTLNFEKYSQSLGICPNWATNQTKETQPTALLFLETNEWRNPNFSCGEGMVGSFQGQVATRVLAIRVRESVFPISQIIGEEIESGSIQH